MVVSFMWWVLVSAVVVVVVVVVDFGTATGAIVEIIFACWCVRSDAVADIVTRRLCFS